MGNISKGKLGEKVAKNFLTQKGYEIVASNYRRSVGEIDLIGIYKEYLVFIEVKARSNINYGYPYEAVNYRKQEKIINTSYLFLQENKYEDYQIRYDIIEIYLNDKKINHIENAFSL